MEILNNTQESIFIEIAKQIGALVTDKNIAYGDSFSKSDQILKVLYPNGINPEQYGDLLTVTRIIDKLFRIATRKDAFGESPWKDVCGYALLSIWRDNKNNVLGNTNKMINPDKPITIPADIRLEKAPVDGTANPYPDYLQTKIGDVDNKFCTCKGSATFSNEECPKHGKAGDNK